MISEISKSGFINLLKRTAKISLILAFSLLPQVSQAGSAIAPQTAEPAAESTVKPFSESEKKAAANIINEFLDSIAAGNNNYEKLISTEVTEIDLHNNYFIDGYILKNYKRAVEINPSGDAICTYTGDGETIRQEFNIIRDTPQALKINSISEKRYQKMNDKRRKCYLNTRAVYKVASLLNNFYEDMQAPAGVNFETLKSKKLLKDIPKCPEDGEIKLALVRGTDSANLEVIASCSRHGDFYEIYKLDDRIALDYEKYNRDVDAEEAPILEKLAGEAYFQSLKLAPAENAFYAALEKKDTAAMQEAMKQALKIDNKLANMYLTIIRSLRQAGNEKAAREAYETAIKVYPKWTALKESLTEKLQKSDEDEEMPIQ
ncbi:MAG TPA: hypothetical protein PKK26_04465 [Candidatus Wallbacteria bacterium]|nr:hypothetical protein [Candidatus Wallbacteria bacterium]